LRLAGALALVCAATPASAFELETSASGASLRWTGPLIYDLDLPPNHGEAARRAMDTWASALHGTLRIELGAETGPPTLGDGRNTIGILDPWDPALGDGSGILGSTLRRYDESTGVMTEADIVLNGEHFVFDPEVMGHVDLESTVLHEAGHVLGLDHTCGEPDRTHPSCFAVDDDPPGTRRRVLEAVMAPTLAPSVQRRSLSDDDVAGVAALYGGRAPPAPFAILGATRPCPGDRIELAGTDLHDRLTVRWRSATGTTAELVILEASNDLLIVDATNVLSDPSRSDVIVTDVNARTTLVGVALTPPTCEPPPPPMNGDVGCSCASSESAGLGLGFVTIALLALARLRWFACVHWLAGAVFIATLAWAPNASAYRCSRVGVDWGPSLVWQSRKVPWVLGAAATAGIATADAAAAEIRTGFDTWSRQACSDLELELAEVRDDVEAGFVKGGPNTNAVVFVQTGWLYDPTVIAVTTSAFDTRTGELFDSDIELNDAHFHFVIAEDGCRKMEGAMDLRNTVTHEVGHLIGLDHPPAQARFEDATMFASAPSCEVQKQTLAEDDIQGLCDIYPLGEATHQCFSPDGPSFLVVAHDDGFGCRHTRTTNGGWGWLGALLLLSAASRRRV